MKKIIIDPNSAHQRLDKFMLKFAPNLPKSVLYKAIRGKDIKLNGAKVSGSEILKINDTVEYYLHSRFFEGNAMDFLHASFVIDSLYDDDNIIIVNKPVGILMHGGGDFKAADTLTNRLLHHLYKNGSYSPETELSFTPAFVNRLDRNTGGLVIAGKNFASLKMLNEKMKSKELVRKYICKVSGIPSPSEATLANWYVKDNITNTGSIVTKDTPNAQEIITKYHLLKSDEATSVLEVELITGRSHQIRLHMSSIGHPIIGDSKYGDKSGEKYQSLVAYYVGFAFTSDAGSLNYLAGKDFFLTPTPFL